jgi:hypothetical protein
MNFYVRNDILDSITPNNVVQRRIDAPHGQWRPAYWLPVQYTSTNRDSGTDAYVISSGKVVALDSESRVVPAGLRTVLGSSFGTTVLTYTSTDVTWGVIDLVTGARVAAPVTYTGNQVADALLERGLVNEIDVLAIAGGAVPVTTQAHCAIVVDLFISRAVGVIAYDAHIWSGKAEEGNQFFTNYSKQHGIQFLTQVQMQAPHHVPTAGSDTFDVATLDGLGTAVYAAGDGVGAGEYWDIANVRQLTRYSALSATAPVVALGLDETPARNTTRTPVASSVAGVLVRERLSADAIAIEGDWYWDTVTAVLFLHSDTWATLLAATASPAITYSAYTVAAADAHKHIHFSGPVRPGMLVSFDTQSNFIAVEEEDVVLLSEIIGRVLEVQAQPITLLKNVKTGWAGAAFSAANKMPGSATAGFTDLITLSGETVGAQVVTLNVSVV